MRTRLFIVAIAAALLSAGVAFAGPATGMARFATRSSAS